MAEKSYSRVISVGELQCLIVTQQPSLQGTGQRIHGEEVHRSDQWVRRRFPTSEMADSGSLGARFIRKGRWSQRPRTRA